LKTAIIKSFQDALEIALVADQTLPLIDFFDRLYPNQKAA
jgi:hypothetical protein